MFQYLTCYTSHVESWRNNIVSKGTLIVSKFDLSVKSYVFNDRILDVHIF